MIQLIGMVSRLLIMLVGVILVLTSVLIVSYSRPVQIIDDVIPQSFDAGQQSGLHWYTDNTHDFSMLVPKHVDGNPVLQTSDVELGMTKVGYIRASDQYEWKWEIFVASVSSDTELALFIDKHSGAAKSVADGECTFGLMPATGLTTYDINLSEPGAHDGDQGCSPGSKVYIKYSPRLKKAALWHAGQDIGFHELVEGEDFSYEEAMAASFNFRD